MSSETDKLDDESYLALVREIAENIQKVSENFLDNCCDRGISLANSATVVETAYICNLSAHINSIAELKDIKEPSKLHEIKRQVATEVCRQIMRMTEEDIKNGEVINA